MATTAEREAARIETLERRAAALRAQSDAKFDQAHNLTKDIPFGQPILVGHHSEKRHRRTIDRAHNAMGKAVELSKTADKLDAIHVGGSIMTSDDDAVEGLNAKVQELEAQRAKMVATNKAWRTYEKKGDRSPLYALGLTDAGIDKLTEQIAQSYSWDKQPYPSYSLTNLGARIRDAKKRAEQVAKQKAMEEWDEQVGEVTIGVRPAEDRVRITFPARVAGPVYDALKRGGWRWTPSLGCWQRHCNAYALQEARRIAALA